VIDGRLDDACYAALPVMDQFYKYWSPSPLPPPLRTAARLCYDDRGLYMGITMFEEQLDQIRAEVTGRDNPETWHDDCVEIMVDPHNTGASYFKFTTNANAVRHDQKASNLVLDDGWSVEGWQVKTSRGDGAWFIEFFLPWSDVEAQAREGEIWSFDLVRYGWATGSFKGVSWSLGGSGASPQKHGYLGFGRFAPYPKDKLRQMADIIRQTKGDRFRLVLRDVVLTHEPCGLWMRRDLAAWIQGAQAAARDGLTEAGAAVDSLPAGADRNRLEKTMAELTDQAGQITQAHARDDLQPGPTLLAYYDYLGLRRKAIEAKWEAMLLELVSAAAK